MSAILGYVAVIALSLWLIGPWLGLLAVPFMIPVVERRLRALGIPVAGDLRKLDNLHQRTPEEASIIRAHSDAMGPTAVLFGRALAVGVAPTLYLHLAIPDAPAYFDGWLFVPIWWMSRDRLLFPLAVIGLQLGVRMMLGR